MQLIVYCLEIVCTNKKPNNLFLLLCELKHDFNVKKDKFHFLTNSQTDERKTEQFINEKLTVIQTKSEKNKTKTHTKSIKEKEREGEHQRTLLQMPIHRMNMFWILIKLKHFDVNSFLCAHALSLLRSSLFRWQSFYGYFIIWRRKRKRSEKTKNQKHRKNRHVRATHSSSLIVASSSNSSHQKLPTNWVSAFPFYVFCFVVFFFYICGSTRFNWT